MRGRKMSKDIKTSTKIALVMPDQSDIQHVIKLRGVARIGVQPNLGIGSIATVTSQANWNVKIFDNYLRRMPWWKFGEMILNYEPTIVAISMNSLNVFESKKLLNFLRRKSENVKFVAGGLFATLYHEDCTEFDHIFCGEGELKFLEFLEEGVAKGDTSKFPKVIYAERIEDLDSLPFPDRSLFDPGYLSTAENLPGEKIQNLFTARGCKFKCRFCHNSSTVNFSLKCRSAEKVVEEIRYLKDECNAAGIYFVEDTFTASPRRVFALEQILKRPENADLLELKYLAYTRVSPLSDKVLEALASMNFVSLFVGVESGSDRTLKEINKGYTAEKARRTLKRIRKFGIDYGAGFMIGFPHENEDDIKKTWDFAMDPQHSYTYFQTYCGLPISEIYYECQELGLVEEWIGRIFAAKTLHVSRERLRELEESFPRNKYFPDWPEGGYDDRKQKERNG